MKGVCKHCGAILEPYVVPFASFDIYKPCMCEGARREREEETKRESERDIAETLAAACDRAQIPPDYALYDEYGSGRSIYLYGEQGRGKTERACGALRGYLSKGIKVFSGTRHYCDRSAAFVSVPELFLRMRKTFSTKESEYDVLMGYAGVGMLCLDDLGKGEMTKWKVERLYTILDIRLREGRPTVITSNYDPDTLTAIIATATDEATARAVWSRIEGMCKIGEIKGRDWRKVSKDSQ